MEPWKTVSRENILNFNKFLTVEKHCIELPDGKIIEDWPWLVTPDFINVAVITVDRRFLCFRQTKYGVDGISLASVGGYIEPGEDPLDAAKRELLEETGYEAPEWKSLGQYVVDGNRGVGKAHFFLAAGAVSVTRADADDLEEQELVFLARHEVVDNLARGEFKALPWAAVMAIALLHCE